MYTISQNNRDLILHLQVEEAVAVLQAHQAKQAASQVKKE
jgi:hypothetical protein